MQTTIIALGIKLSTHVAFFEALMRYLEGCAIGTIYQLDDCYDLDLDAYVKQKSAHIVFVGMGEHMALLGKLLGTKFGVTCVFQQDMLVPKNAEVFGKGLYRLRGHEGLCIDVVVPNDHLALPYASLPPTAWHTTLHILGYDYQKAKIALDSIWDLFGIKYALVVVAKGWLRLDFDGEQKAFIGALQKLFGRHLVIGSSIVPSLIAHLKQKSQFVGFAESCTGGGLSHYLTAHKDASCVFETAIVSYANLTKAKVLGVRESALNEFGAVSEEVVEQMLYGMIHRFDADYAVAISGIAGPFGATPQKRVGTVVIGVASLQNQHINTYHFKGDRAFVQHQSITQSIADLINTQLKDFNV